MPTYDKETRFLREYGALTAADRAAFLVAAADFVVDLRRRSFRASLRLHALPGHPGIFSMSWGNGGRALFEYGPQVHPGDPHVIWRRIGGHEIYDDP